MRVIVPTVPSMLHPDCVPAILEAGYKAEVVNVGTDPFDYWRLLSEVFSSREQVCFVEHDVIVTREILHGLEVCPGVYCANPYENGGIPLLGCTRVRLDSLPAIRIPEAEWIELDGVMGHALHEAGYDCHSHKPAPQHHHGWAY